MSDQRPEQPDQGGRPVPANILRRPLKLKPMRRIKNQGSKDCTCTKPVPLHHAGGKVVSCVRCRGHLVEEVE